MTREEADTALDDIRLASQNAFVQQAIEMVSDALMQDGFSAAIELADHRNCWTTPGMRKAMDDCLRILERGEGEAR